MFLAKTAGEKMLLSEMGAVGGRMMGFAKRVSNARQTGRKKNRINTCHVFSLNMLFLNKSVAQGEALQPIIRLSWKLIKIRCRRCGTWVLQKN
jgi:hypothetical protein